MLNTLTSGNVLSSVELKLSLSCPVRPLTVGFVLATITIGARCRVGCLCGIYRIQRGDILSTSGASSDHPCSGGLSLGAAISVTRHLVSVVIQRGLKCEV